MNGIIESFVAAWDSRKLADSRLAEMADKLADSVAAGDCKIGDSFTIGDGRKFRIIDAFGKSNTIYRPVPVRRIELEVIK